MVRFHSSPNMSTMSPGRHHFRLANESPREIKETLDAKWSVDSSGKKMLNQYRLEEDIGRGSFGTVRVAIDVGTNIKYAVKEYSKSRLQKVRRTEEMQRRRRRDSKPVIEVDSNSPLNLVRREIAIMKKLDHPNIVSLIEVLDDPVTDKLYMILEWCEKGVILPGDYSDGNMPSPYSEEQCRLFFRDMVLGTEYLHSQGVIHRDIKVENVLLSEDDVVKIVDFGVSEMFEKNNDVVKRTAGSPAYMAPELAMVSNGTWTKKSSSLAGKPTDIWSLGVTLFCILFGRLPFRSDTVQGLFDNIISDEPDFHDDAISPELKDLFGRILEKNADKRIKMNELREHPWVTMDGQDPLLSTAENTAGSIALITEEDLQGAIEKVEEVMDLDYASQRLQKLHGWRGNLSIRRPLSPTIEIAQHPLDTASLTNKPSYSKLIAALDEVIYTNPSKTRPPLDRSVSSHVYSSDPSLLSASSSSIDSSHSSSNSFSPK